MFSEKTYSNKEMMVEFKKQASQMGIMQMTLCKTANSLLGTLNQNTQQSQEHQRKPKKHHQQHNQTDSSDDADQYE